VAEADQPAHLTTPAKAGPDIAARVFAERVRLFHRQLIATAGASFAMAVLLVAIVWVESGPLPSLLPWISVMTAIQFVRLLLFIAYQRRQPPIEEAPEWSRRAIVTTAFSGLCWGASVILFFDAHLPTNLITTTMAATGIAAGGAVTLSMLPRAYFAYLVAHIPVLIVALATAGGFANEVFAAAFVVFLVVLYSAVTRMSATLEESLRLRFERADMIDSLDAARRYAESAERVKSDFLAMVTRELKMPLDTIIGHAALIGDLPGTAGSGRLETYVTDIRRSASRLVAVINDILDLLRADAGRLDLQEGLFSVGATIERCRQLVQAHADNRAIGLRLAIEEGLPAVRGDARMIRQALLNLLSNAIRFTPADGYVQIGARRASDGGLIIEVVDTGIGMSAPALARALEPFGGTAGGHSGPGLGLPLAKRIIEQHGGRLEIVSQPGSGTTVRLQLPPERIAA
jgi:signal transduction histidine kinase